MAGFIDKALSDAAELRMKYRNPSRPACWECGLSQSATCHYPDVGLPWVFHAYEPGILTRVRKQESPEP